MKTLLVMFALVPAMNARAEFQISTPNDMVRCMQQYVRNWATSPELLSGWEQAPSYESNGNYFFASWHTSPSMTYGTLQRSASVDDNFNCGYATDSFGTPLKDQGFCVAKVSAGEIKFDLIKGMGGNEKVVQKTLAIISESKLFCLDLPRP